MNKKILVILVLTMTVIWGTFLFIKGTEEPTTSPLDNDNETDIVDDGDKAALGDTDSVVEANNQFALDLYSKYKSEEGNVFFSPYSISTALAMTYEGAKGQTAEEMQDVLYFPEDDNKRRSGYAGLYNEINKEGKEYKLHTANALWAQQNYPFLDEYFSVVKEYYGGEVTNLDFAVDTERSRVTINDWVEDKTNDKIKNLIPKGAISPITRLVLTNAIYFKGEWIRQFNEDDTEDRNFRVTPNDTIKVPMMQRTDEEAMFNYAEDNKLQILEMPYSGEDLSMLVLLPKNDDTGALEDSLTAKQLTKWKKDLKEQRVKVFIPKFKFETKYFMADTLKKMGMPTAFSESADFSGMTGNKDLMISKVIHQAFVEVNEEGTEAAAATAVVMELTSAPGGSSSKIPVFKADHPFIFIIQEKETGNILFIGRVNDPSE